MWQYVTLRLRSHEMSSFKNHATETSTGSYHNIGICNSVAHAATQMLPLISPGISLLQVQFLDPRHINSNALIIVFCNLIWIVPELFLTGRGMNIAINGIHCCGNRAPIVPAFLVNICAVASWVVIVISCEAHPDVVQSAPHMRCSLGNAIHFCLAVQPNLEILDNLHQTKSHCLTLTCKSLPLSCNTFLMANRARKERS